MCQEKSLFDFISRVLFITMNSKKYYIQTYGCQANIKDSQIMAGVLEALGFEKTNQYFDADIVIINTCSVRQKAEDKIYGWGVKFPKNSQKLSKKQKAEEQKTSGKTKRPIVFVTGCMIGSAKGERQRIILNKLEKKLSWADYLLAPEEEYRIPNILVKEGLVDEWTAKALNLNRLVDDVKYNPELDNETEWAYVNISTGCDNFCTYCVVPYSRGKEISRGKNDILDEINHLVEKGYKNIMLVGQNVNSWGLDHKTKFELRAGSKHKIPFAQLLRDVHSIDGVEKINFISSNPFDFTQDLVETLALPKIDKYLHIAVQSGDNEILKKMNRRHTVEEFKNLIADIRKVVPDMKFGTDIIVGFPSETEDQFMKTVELIKEIKFSVAYIAMYSPREGTIAERKMKDDVPLKEKKRRHAYITKVFNENKPS